MLSELGRDTRGSTGDSLVGSDFGHVCGVTPGVLLLLTVSPRHVTCVRKGLPRFTKKSWGSILRHGVDRDPQSYHPPGTWVSWPNSTVSVGARVSPPHRVVCEFQSFYLFVFRVSPVRRVLEWKTEEKSSSRPDRHPPHVSTPLK